MNTSQFLSKMVSQNARVRIGYGDSENNRTHWHNRQAKLSSVETTTIMTEPYPIYRKGNTKRGLTITRKIFDTRKKINFS